MTLVQIRSAAPHARIVALAIWAVTVLPVPAFAGHPGAPPVGQPAVRHEGPHHAVAVMASACAPAEITLAPKAGFKFNTAYPTRISLKAGAGVTLSKDALAKDAATRLDDLGAAFPVAYSCTGAGGSVSANLKFSVCNEQTCEMVKDDVTWKAAAATTKTP